MCFDQCYSINIWKAWAARQGRGKPAVPAGGATAALNAAQAAALLAMAARYCDGPKHAGHAEAVDKTITEAHQLRHVAHADADRVR
jgi:formiminotetrahydrofolate cyclodeaminase